MKNPELENIDRLVLGNYHERTQSIYIKYVNQTSHLDKVRDVIMLRMAEKSNNHFLCSVLDSPTGVRDVFRLSRILFKQQSHLIYVGGPGSNKYEILQVATMLNDVVMFELNAPKYNEPSIFENAFREALLTVARLDGLNCFIVINDEQLRDPVYIDFVHVFISYIGKDENCVLMTEDFTEKLLEIEYELFYKNKENFKYDKNKKPDKNICMRKSIEKLVKHVHVVMMVNDF